MSNCATWIRSVSAARIEPFRDAGVLINVEPTTNAGTCKAVGQTGSTVTAKQIAGKLLRFGEVLGEADGADRVVRRQVGAGLGSRRRCAPGTGTRRRVDGCRGRRGTCAPARRACARRGRRCRRRDPAGSQSMSSTSRAATSRVSMGWNRTPLQRAQRGGEALDREASSRSGRGTGWRATPCGRRPDASSASLDAQLGLVVRQRDAVDADDRHVDDVSDAGPARRCDEVLAST